MANTAFVGAGSAAGMGFFSPGKQLNFWEAMRVVAWGHPCEAELGRAGQAEMQLPTAACQCCSAQPVQLCNICRQPELRGFAGMGSGHAVTAHRELVWPSCVAQCGNGTQLLLRARGQNCILVPASACRLALGCNRNISHPL